MVEYIKREDALKIAEEYYDHPIGKDIAKSIFCLPAADVRHVVRGKWITVKHPLYECSECGAVYQDVGYGFNFCPNCGADMREKS